MSEGSASTRHERLRQGSAARRARQKQEVRRALLDAATALFEREGYEGFSLRQVAEATGYSATTVYLYFQDKDDLLHHVALEGFRSFGEDLQRAFDSADTALARIRALGRAYLRFGLAHPLHYRLMFMVRGEFLERENPPGYESIADSFGFLRRAVQEGLARGELRAGSPEVYVSLLWGMVHGLAALHLATPYFPRESIEPLFEGQMEVIARSLRP